MENKQLVATFVSFLAFMCIIIDFVFHLFTTVIWNKVINV